MSRGYEVTRYRTLHFSFCTCSMFIQPFSCLQQIIKADGHKMHAAEDEDSEELCISTEVITCSICFDNFTQPKTLPCGHSLCLSPCLENLCKENQKLCPLCRKPFNLPPLGEVKTCQQTLWFSIYWKLQNQIRECHFLLWKSVRKSLGSTLNLETSAVNMKMKIVTSFASHV